MIYIDVSTAAIDLFIEKHLEIDSSVNFSLTRSIDSSLVVNSGDVSVHENYYVYYLDCSALSAGQYEYQIIDSSSLNVYESGLLYKVPAESSNQNLIENITYESN